jgi:hypothetical protein
VGINTAMGEGWGLVSFEHCDMFPVSAEGVSAALEALYVDPARREQAGRAAHLAQGVESDRKSVAG